MASNRRGGDWPERRLAGPVRAVVVIVAGFGLLLCAQLLSDDVRETLAYRKAAVCDGRGCIRPETGTVLDRSIGERCSWSGTGSSSTWECSHDYLLEVSRPGGGTGLHAVADDVYQQAEKGDRVRLGVWRGTVVRLEAYGKVAEYGPPAANRTGGPLLLLWVVLFTAVWVLLSGRPLVLVPMGAAFVVVGGLNVVFGPDLLWTSPTTFWTAEGVLLVGTAIGVGYADRIVRG
ncbi:hypothetical protein ACFV7Q_16025 [Streptomyces sp. NPDC059851]|uniref:hypothetical protein n=1 Tax=Streptomyces sp. NPDC059851 TaxID=3346971 RepID=UPI003662C9CA